LVLSHHIHRLSSLMGQAVRAGEEGLRAAHIAAREALDVYAPLAHRLGMHQLKNDLEELAFQFLFPEEHAVIAKEIDERFSLHQVVLTEQIKVLKQALVEDTLFMNSIARVSVEGRSKQPYSIWRKMQQRRAKGVAGASVEEVLDRLAVRVVFEPKPLPGEDAEAVRRRGEELTYHVLDLVHSQWDHSDFRVKDYVSRPKANGYQSLHTTARTRHHGMDWPFEVQIRTDEMHRVAEWGMAAHVDYKSDQAGEPWIFLARDESVAEEKGFTQDQHPPPATPRRREQQVRDETVPPGSISVKTTRGLFPAVGEVQRLKSLANVRDYTGWLHTNLSERRVFVFIDDTLWDLRRGVTVRDAIAEQLHSGPARGPVSPRTPRKIRINGHSVDLDYQLRNGDALQLV